MLEFGEEFFLLQTCAPPQEFKKRIFQFFRQFFANLALLVRIE